MLIQLEKHYKNNHNFRNADSMWATIAEKINSSFWKEDGAGARQGAPCQAKWRAIQGAYGQYCMVRCCVVQACMQ